MWKVTNENEKFEDFTYEFQKKLKISLTEDTIFDLLKKFKAEQFSQIARKRGEEYGLCLGEFSVT